jgi:hypothetical protein
MRKAHLVHRLAVGALFLLAPLLYFDWRPGPSGKLIALRFLIFALSGVVLITLSLWFDFRARQQERLANAETPISKIAARKIR